MPVKRWASQGLHSIQVSGVGDEGFIAGFGNLTAADTGDSSAARLLIGGVSAPAPLPPSNRVQNRGRDGYIASRLFVGAQNDLNYGFEDFDGDLSAFLNKDTILTVGEWDIIPEGGQIDFQNTAWLVARHATSKDPDTDGMEGYENSLSLSVSGRVAPGNMEWQAVGSFNVEATASPVQKVPSGETALAKHGKQTIYAWRWFSEYPCAMTCFVADGTEDEITVGFTPITTAKSKVWDFTTGTQLTVSSVNTSTDKLVLSAAPTTGHICFALYETSDI